MHRPLPGLVALLLLAATSLHAQSPRIHTDRAAGQQLLQLPKEEDAFGFVVFGDRTGGPVTGIRVLEQAVIDTNLLDPDLVFTVGDLINGYNQPAQWMSQAEQYKTAMSQLRMPWFPVAGNHDIYWRGPNRPEGEHEQNYEAEFGPLWYALQHKKCWFIALYTDEGNPDTGEKNFSKPECQRMSPEQFGWLEKTLEKTRDARHVFVFMHHPRWLPQYGDDWERVHRLLAQSGNVTAIFAGHIHRMRYDGTIDGIQYYTVASVGAHLGMNVPQAGYLHQFHVVTVRPEGIVVAALPVGTVMNPQEITGQLSDEVGLLSRSLRPEVTECVAAGTEATIRADGAVDAIATVEFDNPSTRPVELEILPLGDASWRFSPDHQHVIIAAGKRGGATFRVERAAQPDNALVLPRLQVRCDYLATTSRIGLPMREHEFALPPPRLLETAAAAAEGVLSLDGKNACLAVPAAQLQVPDGPLTLETWLCGEQFGGRRGLLAKSQQSDYCLFCSDGKPSFSVYLDGTYVTAAATEAVLEPGRWHHFAGVYDGNEVRLYIDGKLLARQSGSGTRKTNDLPFYVGADPDGNGRPTSFFHGRVDEVRISKIARYDGESFEPPMQHEGDPDTLLLLRLDSDFGPWTPDSSPSAAHPRRRGSAHCTVESRPEIR